MRVLVTGAGGQLGQDLTRHCRDLGDDVHPMTSADLDVTDRSRVRDAVAGIRPDVIVNCAAFTAVDACESEVETAMAVNADGVSHLAEASASVEAHLVQLSTDYVFDGTADRPYREDDAPSPISVYGRSKLAGERAVGPAGAIARTSWVCGEHGSNVVTTVLRLAAEGTPMRFVDDQRGCPTFTADLAPAVRQLGVERATGIFHLTNARAVSWYEFAGEILRAAGGDPAQVTPIRTAELDPPRAAPRPANSELENARWVATGHDPLRDHAAPLAELVSRLR